MSIFRRIHSRSSSKHGTKFAYVPAAIALIVIMLAGALAERQVNERYQQQLRAQVFAQLSVVRARLEGNINGNIKLVRGFVAALETEPEMSQARFGRLASNLLSAKSQIKELAAAPDLVVTRVYPLAGNEGALGLDYRQERRPARRRAARPRYRPDGAGRAGEAGAGR